MNTQDNARERLVQDRQHQEHVQETMLNRSEAELDQPENRQVAAQLRETLTQQRQHQEHVQESMLSRSEAEL